MNNFFTQQSAALQWPELAGDIVINSNCQLTVSAMKNLNVQITEGAAVEIICYQSRAIQPSQLNFRLEGTHSSLKLYCLTEISGQHKVEQVVKVEHLAPATESELFFYSLIDQQAEQVLDSVIEIEKGYVNSSTNFQHQVILLSETAKINSTPRLQIEEKDVKASHGVGIGQLDEEKIFYLQTRGFSEKQARDLIKEGFLTKFWERVKFLE